MPITFVLINTEIGLESKVLEALKKIDAVEEAYMVYGVYDVVARVKGQHHGQTQGNCYLACATFRQSSSTLTMIVSGETR